MLTRYVGRKCPVTGLISLILGFSFAGCYTHLGLHHPGRTPGRQVDSLTTARDSLGMREPGKSHKESGSSIISDILFGLLFGSDEDDNPDHRHGKLSGAMDKASDKNIGTRKTDTQPKPDYSRTTAASGSTGNAVCAESHTDTLHSPILSSLGLTLGSGMMKSNDLYGFTSFGLSYEALESKSSHTRVDIHAGFALAPIQQTSYLSQSINDGVTMLQVGCDVNYFTTPWYTFMGHCFYGGVRYTYMFWHYKNPVLADRYDDYGNRLGTEEINSDGLSGFDVYAGMGWNPMQTRYFSVGLEAGPGAMVWLGETSEGFENDVFPDFGYFIVSATVKFNFKYGTDDISSSP